MSEIVEVNYQVFCEATTRAMNEQAREMILALVDHATENLIVDVFDESTGNPEEETAFLRDLQAAIQNRIDAIEHKRRQRSVVPSAELIPMQFRLPADFVWEFKQAAANKRMKLNEYLEACFEAARQSGKKG